ncbi:hypothetical protein LguiB_002635 [Lonicera macranthoides]
MINSDISSQEDLVDVLLNLEQSADLDLPITANNVKAIILVCIRTPNMALRSSSLHVPIEAITENRVTQGKICCDLYINDLVISVDGNLLNSLAVGIKIGRHYIVDAISVEESQMSSALYVSVNRHRRICRMTKHASEQFIIKYSEIAAAEATEEEL